MPRWLQVITSVIPLHCILDVIRGIILKDVGAETLYPQVIALAVFGTAVISWPPRASLGGWPEPESRLNPKNPIAP